MHSPPKHNSPWRTAAQALLAAVALLTAGRLVQLAVCTTDSSSVTATPAAPGSAGGSPPRTPSPETPAPRSTEAANAELAELYKACPLAAVIDLQTIATSPEKIDAILPPYRELAAREPVTTPIEPAVPRIAYPVRINRSAPEPQPNIRVAQLPRIATNIPAAASSSDWLIDPKEWLTEEPKSPAATEPTSQPQAPSETTSTIEPPTPEPATTAPAAPAPTTNLNADPAPLELPSANPGIEQTAPPAPPAPAQPKPIFTPPAATPEPLPTPPGVPTNPPPATSIPNPELQAPSPAAPGSPPPAVDPHLELFAKNAYPSARECAVCHEEIYQQWSVSAHAYAQVSPMFNKFEQRLNDLSQGTVGYFCMRCHAPIATSLATSRDQPIWTLPESAREGITCVACHRVQYAYGKSNGERRVETGDIFAPVYGGIGGDGVADAIAHKDQLKLKTSPEEKGPSQNIHVNGIYFQPLTRSEFCTPCHQVAVYPGIKLEVVWEQYRASPACKKGIQCQDCHMGRVPGLPLGYECGAIAKVNGKTVNDNRKKSNHIFFGPNYPIAHPGVFPFHLKANRWTIDQWLTFDWRAGWGTKEFEDAIADGKVACQFPPVWAEADDRADAREIIDDNLKKMELKRDLRVQVMENGSKVEGPFFDSSLCRGQDVNFHYMITNTNDGHNLLTASLGAQPQLWGNVVLIAPDGTRLWETGYTDSAGDVASIHSNDVRNGTLPFDWQLFNLQTMFLITGAKGTDREFYVPVNLDFDQLPFIRPGAQPITTLNHPPFIRMESQSLSPLGVRKIPYCIPGGLVRQPGTYRLSFRLRSRSEPIYFMRFCQATEEMERSMNEWMIDVHPMSVEFEVR